MKKTVIVAALAAALFAANAFATYIVVLKNGQTFKAKAKWTIQNGKAIVALENGQSLTIDPSLIDVVKSEAATQAGLGGAKILNTVHNSTAPEPQPQESTLGSAFHLKKGAPTPAPAAAAATAPITPSGNGAMSQEVLDK